MLQPDSAMGPALQAAYLMMEALGGKLLLFQTSVPNMGVGKITQRDNPTLYNTDSEHRLRVPEDIFFKKFAAEASKAQISIDVFSFRSAGILHTHALGACSQCLQQPCILTWQSLIANDYLRASDMPNM